MLGQHRPDDACELPHPCRHSLPMRHGFLLPHVESRQIAVRIVCRVLHHDVRQVLPDQRVPAFVYVTVLIVLPAGFVTGYLQSDVRDQLLRRFESLDAVYDGIYRGGGLDADALDGHQILDILVVLIQGIQIVLRLLDVLQAGLHPAYHDIECGMAQPGEILGCRFRRNALQPSWESDPELVHVTLDPEVQLVPLLAAVVEDPA